MDRTRAGEPRLSPSEMRLLIVRLFCPAVNKTQNPAHPVQQRSGRLFGAPRPATICANVASTPTQPAGARNSTDSTRHRLLNAAYELLLDEGYHAATVQSVARRAQLTTGAIYANFANKHELLVQAVLRRWVRSPEAAPLRVTGGDGEDDVDIGDLAALLALQLSEPPEPEHRLLTEVTGAAIRDQKAEAMLRASIERIEEVAEHAIEQAKADGRVDEALSTEALVAVIVNLYLGAITSKSFDLAQPRREEVLEVLARLDLAPRSNSEGAKPE
jgi:AcrR family transcriptional regulator